MQILCDHSQGKEMGAAQPQSNCWSKEADYKVTFFITSKQQALTPLLSLGQEFSSLDG